MAAFLCISLFCIPHVTNIYLCASVAMLAYVVCFIVISSRWRSRMPLRPRLVISDLPLWWLRVPPWSRVCLSYGDCVCHGGRARFFRYVLFAFVAVTCNIVISQFMCRCMVYSNSFSTDFFLSSVFSTNVFACGLSELNDVGDLSQRCLADKLPEIVLGSRPDSTTLTYLNGFKRWRAWARRFPEITVLPATPAYVSLYLLSVMQPSNSPAPVQNALYSIRWAHEIAGLNFPTIHALPQKVVE